MDASGRIVVMVRVVLDWYKLEVDTSRPRSPHLFVLIGPVDVERGACPSHMEF